MYKSLTGLTTAAALLLALVTPSAQANTPLVVAVLDTGITEHSDLGWTQDASGAGRAGGVVLPGYDFVSDPWTAGDGDGWDADPSDMGDGITPAQAENSNCSTRTSSWHGTHVAGTIAGQGTSDERATGVAPNAQILPVRIMGRCGGNTADVAAGLMWAAGESVPGVPDNPTPARIINLSLSGVADRCPTSLQTAIDVARDRGSVVVVAAGSTGRGTVDSTPANCDGVIVVGATDKKGHRSPLSNYGTEVTLSTFAGNLAANTKQGIFTTSNKGKFTPRSAQYAYFEGSSAAAARVSGALAALLDENPAASNAELTGQLLASLNPFAPGQCDKGENFCGAGILDIDALLD